MTLLCIVYTMMMAASRDVSLNTLVFTGHAWSGTLLKGHP